MLIFTHSNKVFLKHNFLNPLHFKVSRFKASEIKFGVILMLKMSNSNDALDKDDELLSKKTPFGYVNAKFKHEVHFAKNFISNRLNSNL